MACGGFESFGRDVVGELRGAVRLLSGMCLDIEGWDRGVRLSCMGWRRMDWGV